MPVMTDKQEGTDWSAVITPPANSQTKPIRGGSSANVSHQEIEDLEVLFFKKLKDVLFLDAD